MCTAICDYSLHAIASRDAEKGDVLEVYLFNHMTKGMLDAMKARPVHGTCDTCAVCLKPGTELSLTDPVVELYAWPSWFPVFKAKRLHRHATATFRKLEPKGPEHMWLYQHRDGIEFPDGKQVLLNNLEVGQTMGVLQVSQTDREKADRQEPDYAVLYTLSAV